MTTAPRNENGRSELAGLHDALAQVVWIREEFDPSLREQALEELEQDLVAKIDRLEEPWRAT